MNIDFKKEENKSVIQYLKSIGDINYSETESLFTHSEIIEILWETVPKLIPVECKEILYGFPILVNPESGIIFGLACGTNPIMLKFKDEHLEKILSETVVKTLSSQDGVYANSNDIGKGWVFCFSFADDIENLCFTSYLQSN